MSEGLLDGHTRGRREKETVADFALERLSNAQVQLQARYHHRGVAASEKCLSAATFVRRCVASATCFSVNRVARRGIDLAPDREDREAPG